MVDTVGGKTKATGGLQREWRAFSKLSIEKLVTGSNVDGVVDCLLFQSLYMRSRRLEAPTPH